MLYLCTQRSLRRRQTETWLVMSAVGRLSASAGLLLFLLLSPRLAFAEFSQELSLQLQYNVHNGYYLLDNEKKPLTETVSKLDFSYGYFLSENIEAQVSYRHSDQRLVADLNKYHIIDRKAALGFLLNLPDGAKGYAISTSRIIPYIGLFYLQRVYPNSSQLYVLEGKSNGVEFMVGLRYFLFQRIAWNMWAKATNFSQSIQTDPTDETTKGYREGTAIDIQLFGLTFLW